MEDKVKEYLINKYTTDDFQDLPADLKITLLSNFLIDKVDNEHIIDALVDFPEFKSLMLAIIWDEQDEIKEILSKMLDHVSTYCSCDINKFIKGRQYNDLIALILEMRR